MHKPLSRSTTEMIVLSVLAPEKRPCITVVFSLAAHFEASTVAAFMYGEYRVLCAKAFVYSITNFHEREKIRAFQCNTTNLTR